MTFAEYGALLRFARSRRSTVPPWVAALAMIAAATAETGRWQATAASTAATPHTADVGSATTCPGAGFGGGGGAGPVGGAGGNAGGSAGTDIVAGGGGGGGSSPGFSAALLVVGERAGSREHESAAGCLSRRRPHQRIAFASAVKLLRLLVVVLKRDPRGGAAKSCVLRLITDCHEEILVVLPGRVAIDRDRHESQG